MNEQRISLHDAEQLAARLHAGQVDKGGAPYIYHPLRMADRASRYSEAVVALFHDALEDTACTVADLEAAGIGPVEIAAIQALTRRDGETYDAFIDRVAQNPLARAVKILDLHDNLQEWRIPVPTQGDLFRWAKYRRALKRLGASSDSLPSDPREPSA